MLASVATPDAEALKSIRTRARQITSALTFAETSRAMRARIGERLTPDAERAAVRALRRFERRCYLVAVTDDILARVRRRFPLEPVRTLMQCTSRPSNRSRRLQLTAIVTRDHRVRENVTALGYSVE